MKKLNNNMIACTALTLALSSTFSMDTLAENSKNLKPTTDVPAPVAITTGADATPVPATAIATDPNSVDKAAVATERKVLAEKQPQIIQDAKTAVSEIEQALIALENKDTKTAVATLKSALTNLESVLKNHPGMALVPVDVDVEVTDFEADNAQVSKAIKDANNLLRNGELQALRKLLIPMASEIRVDTLNIPLGIFPEAIKNAIGLIESGKTMEAMNILNDALNAEVEVTEIIPLPILRAEALLTEAALLEHTQDLSKEKSRAAVLKFTNAAKDKLKLAELLGYGGKNDYLLLYTAIDELQATISSEKTQATWDKIKQSITDLKNRLMPVKK